MADVELIPTREVLERYNWLTERRLRSWVSQRRIPCRKVRGRLLFDPQDFEDLLNAGYIAAESSEIGRDEAPRATGGPLPLADDPEEDR